MTWERLADYRGPGASGKSIEMFPVSEDGIASAEATIGRSFPHQLKEVWRGVGCGLVSASLDGSRRTDLGNVLLGPDAAALAFLCECPFQFNERAGRAIPFCYPGDEALIVLVERDDGNDDSNSALAPDVCSFLDKLLVDASTDRQFLTDSW